MPLQKHKKIITMRPREVQFSAVKFEVEKVKYKLLYKYVYGNL